MKTPGLWGLAYVAGFRLRGAPRFGTRDRCSTTKRNWCQCRRIKIHSRHDRRGFPGMENSKSKISCTDRRHRSISTGEHHRKSPKQITRFTRLRNRRNPGTSLASLSHHRDKVLSSSSAISRSAKPRAAALLAEEVAERAICRLKRLWCRQSRRYRSRIGSPLSGLLR